MAFRLHLALCVPKKKKSCIWTQINLFYWNFYAAPVILAFLVMVVIRRYMILLGDLAETFNWWDEQKWNGKISQSSMSLNEKKKLQRAFSKEEFGFNYNKPF